MRKERRAGRHIKRTTARNQRLTIRISTEHLKMLNAMVKESGSTIISQADIVEWALVRYASQDYNMYFDFSDTLKVPNKLD